MNVLAYSLYLLIAIKKNSNYGGLFSIRLLLKLRRNNYIEFLINCLHAFVQKAANVILLVFASD